MIKVNVIICTYNPDQDIFNEVLLSLKNQTLSKQYWNLIIVNNNSDIAIPEIENIDWHNGVRIINEQKPGLAYARLAGFNQCEPNSLIVFVDDDNLLSTDYLETCVEFSLAHPQVGCFGGKSLPRYETAPPDWFHQLGISLGCQDFGNTLYISQYKDDSIIKNYPHKAPIGTGLAITYHAFLIYKNSLDDKKLKLGRKRDDLTSAEDNDIVLTVVRAGFQIAYIPQLSVTHIIPKYRYGFEYLKEMAYKSSISWIKVLEIHRINFRQKIPRWTVLPRQIRAWFMLKAWKNDANYIKWKSACGIFQGLSEI